MTSRAPHPRLPPGVAYLWGGTVAALAAIAPWRESIAAALPPCPVHALSGWPCPTCGTGRALLALGNGDLAGALGWNPLATIGFVLFAVGGVVAVVATKLGRALPEPRELPFAFRIACAALLAGNWLYLVAVGR